MNAFAKSNLSVALLRLAEARSKLETMAHKPTATEEQRQRFWEDMGAIQWSVREAVRLVENAAAVDEMESSDTLPPVPESGARKVLG